MFRTLLLGLIAVTAVGCATPVARPIESAGCPARGSDAYYFPAGSFATRWSKDDAFTRKWYSQHLSAMKEFSLSCGAPAGDESYRFLWLRTFHHPIAVRVTRTGDVYSLRAVELSGAGGYEPGRILRQSERRLDALEWADLKPALDRIGFWTPLEPKKSDCALEREGAKTREYGPDEARPVENICIEDLMGNDGAQWIFEGRAGAYRVIDRWTPEDPAFRDAGLMFLNLSGLTPDKKDIY